MLPNGFWLSSLLAGLIICEGYSQNPSVLTASSAHLNAIALHSETVYFFDATALSYQTRALQSLTIPIGVLKGGLEHLGVHDQIFSKRLRYVLLGAKEFRQPSDLGVMRSRKVHFLSFKQSTRLDLQTLTKKAPVAKIMGNDVWEWELRVDTKESLPFIIMQPSDTEIWVATDIEFLQEVLTSLKTSERVLDSRPEWSEVSLSAPIWAVRRYQHDKVKDPIAAGVRFTPTGTAITFFYDTVRQTAVIRYLAGSSDSMVARWKAREPTEVSEIRTGVWQITFVANDRPWSIDKIHALAALFGFGVII